MPELFAMVDSDRVSPEIQELVEQINSYSKRYRHNESVGSGQELDFLFQKAVSSGHPLPIAMCSFELGLDLQRKENFRDAVAKYQEVLPIFSSMSGERALSIKRAAYNNLGTIFAYLGEYSRAGEYYAKAMESLPEDEHHIRGNCLMNMGLVEMEIGNYDRSHKYLLEALEHANACKDAELLATLYNNLGRNAARSSDYRTAIELYREGLTTCREYRLTILEPHILVNLAWSQLESGLASNAVDSFYEALDLEASRLQRYVYIYLLGGLGAALLKQGKVDKAFEFVSEAVQIQETAVQEGLTYGLDGLVKNLETAVECSEKMADIGVALAFEKKRSGYLALMHQDHNAREARRVMISNLETEREIFRLKNIELAGVNQRLEKLNEDKNTFLSIAAHDLKNPLSTIVMLSQYAESELGQNNTEAVKESLVDIRDVSTQMLRLVSDLLNVNQIDHGLQLNIEAVDLPTIAGNVIALWTKNATQKSIAIEYVNDVSAHTDLKIMVAADPMYLFQVIENLVSNAVKFSPAHTTVRIVANIQTRETGDVGILSVIDEGPGLSESDKLRLFTRFAKLSARPTGGEGSTGLGLSICRQIVEAMQGAIEIESDQGCGARFSVVLPLAH